MCDEANDKDRIESELDDHELSPGDPDYDLSESAGYANWEPKPNHWQLPQWFIALISVLLVLGLVLPLALIIY